MHFVTCPKQGPEMDVPVLPRVGFLAYSCPKKGQDFQPSAAPLYPNMGQVPPPLENRLVPRHLHTILAGFILFNPNFGACDLRKVLCKSLQLKEYKRQIECSRKSFRDLSTWFSIQRDHEEYDSRGRMRFCSILEFHLRDISLVLDSFSPSSCGMF